MTGDFTTPHFSADLPGEIDDSFYLHFTWVPIEGQAFLARVLKVE